MMKINGRSRRLWLTFTLFVCLSAAIGIAIAAADSGAGSTAQDNSAGVGGHPRAISATALSVSALSLTEQAVLGVTNAGSIKLLGSIGSGDQASRLFDVTLPNGTNCVTVSHESGTIVEPLNCNSGAYLRLWNDSNGSGDPTDGAISSTRVIVLVSAEVQSVRVYFSDGSSESLTPNSNGVATVETKGATTPTKVVALDTSGNELASLGA